MDFEELLASLNNETAKAILNRIKSGEATSGDFMAAIRFLKENGFKPPPIDGNPDGQALADLVPFPGAPGS